MTIKINEVRAALEPEEPDYFEAAKMGAEIVPHLMRLVKGKDPEMAAKATSLAGMLGSGAGLSVLKAASECADPMIRVAAAGAVQGLSNDDASDVLETLILDTDIGVQKRALMSVPAIPSTSLEQRLSDAVSRGDLPPELSDMAQDIVVSAENISKSEETIFVSEMPTVDTKEINETFIESTYEESEMPKLDSSTDYECISEGRMAGESSTDQLDTIETQDMPEIGDDVPGTDGGYHFDPDELREMPT